MKVLLCMSLIVFLTSDLQFEFVTCLSHIFFTQEVIEPLLLVLEKTQKEKDMKELYSRATSVYRGLLAPRKVVLNSFSTTPFYQKYTRTTWKTICQKKNVTKTWRVTNVHRALLEKFHRFLLKFYQKVTFGKEKSCHCTQIYSYLERFYNCIHRWVGGYYGFDPVTPRPPPPPPQCVEISPLPL